MQSDSMPSTDENSSPDISEEQARYLKWHRLFFMFGALVFGAALVVVIVYLLRILSVPVGIVIWTVVFVFILGGLVSWFEKHGINRFAGTTISYVIMIAIVAAVCFLMFSPMFGIGAQFSSLVDSLPTYINQISDYFNELSNQYSDLLQNDMIQQALQNLLSSVSSSISSFAANGASGAIEAGSAIGNAIMAIGFGLVVAFWMLIELPNLGREARRLIGDAHAEDVNMISATITRVLSGYIKGTVIQCLIIGVVSGVYFAILGVSSPAALGVITGVLNIIPIVGPWFGGGMAFIVSAFTSPVTAVAALIGTIIIQQAVYMFVSPKVMGEAVDIHPALTFIALMAGSAIGGAIGGLSGSLIGALLSIPIVAMAKSIFVYYFEMRTGRRLAADEGVFFKTDAPATAAPNPIHDATGHPSKGKKVVRFGKRNEDVLPDEHLNADKPGAGVEDVDSAEQNKVEQTKADE